MLTQIRLKELFLYDEFTGLFIRKKTNKVTGTLHKEGYIQISVDCKLYLAHRLAWLYMYGNFPKLKIDHKDCNKANNRISNLRDVSNQFNCQNKIRSNKNNKYGLLGAHLDKKTGKFCARISVNGKTIHIGMYKTKEEAHQSYIEAKRIYHPGGFL